MTMVIKTIYDYLTLKVLAGLALGPAAKIP